MASKWQHLKGRVPEAPAGDMASLTADKSFLDKVDAAKVTLAGISLPCLMEELTACNKEWDELEARKKELNVDFEALGQLIKKHFEQQGVTSVKSAGGQTFYVHVEPLVGIKPGCRDLAEAWVLSDPNLDYLWAIQPQQLASWVKDKLENVEDEQLKELEEFLNVQLKTSIRVRKA